MATLILDRADDDARWLIATIADPSHVRPAGRDDKPDDVTARWAGGTLIALSAARVWAIDDRS
jgi:hypothetical protein